MQITNFIYRYLTNRFVNSFFNTVKKEASLADQQAFNRKVKALYNQIFDQHQHLIVDKPAEANLRIVAMVYAIYQSLVDSKMKEQDILDLLTRALLQQQISTIKFVYWTVKAFRIDLFKFITNISKSKQIGAYGKGFDHEIKEDNAQEFRFLVTRCFYHNFFVKVGTPQLTAIMCAYDNAWGNLVNQSGSLVSFTRPQTIGWGGNCCDFSFRRVENEI